jgi:hypothetical protein
MFDLVARDAVRFACRKALDDPTGSWRFAATKRDFDARAFLLGA